MTLKSLFQVNAVVSMLYGISLLLVPGPFMAMYAVNLDAGGMGLAQLFGAALAGFGLLTWFARDAEPSTARHAIVTALCWSDVLGGVVCALGVLRGAFGPMAWSAVVVYAVLAGGYAYFLYGRAGAAAPAT